MVWGHGWRGSSHLSHCGTAAPRTARRMSLLRGESHCHRLLGGSGHLGSCLHGSVAESCWEGTTSHKSCPDLQASERAPGPHSQGQDSEGVLCRWQSLQVWGREGARRRPGGQRHGRTPRTQAPPLELLSSCQTPSPGLEVRFQGLVVAVLAGGPGSGAVSVTQGLSHGDPRATGRLCSSDQPQGQKSLCILIPQPVLL